MKFNEFVQKINNLQETTPNIGDKEVVITTSESSIGCRAFSDINCIHCGIDWEMKQVRIEPISSLYKQRPKITKEENREQLIKQLQAENALLKTKIEYYKQKLFNNS